MGSWEHDRPGVQLRFAKADTKQVPTRGRVLDHIGFDVKDHAAFVKKIEAEGIKLDEPVRKSPTGRTITYITDPGVPASRLSNGHRWGRRCNNRRPG